MEKASKAVLGTPCISLSEPNTAMRCANCCGNSGPARSPSKESGRVCSRAFRWALCSRSGVSCARKSSSLSTHWKKAKHFFYHLYPQRNTSGTSHAPNDAAHRHTACTQQFSEERPHHRCLSPLRVYVRFREILHTEKRLSPAQHGFAPAHIRPGACA